MKIQSLSIVVPAVKCWNDCKFCVSKMHADDYPNMMDSNLPFYDLYESDYIKRLEFARDNGCNVVMLTGNADPQQNRSFLQKFGTMNNNLSKPFRHIEMQTSGVGLDAPYLRFLRNHVGVNTIALSVSSFDDGINQEICGMPKNLWFRLEELCKLIKTYDFNLRICVNMTDGFGGETPDDIFTRCAKYKADQVTFRVLYTSGNNTKQDKWINEHKMSEYHQNLIKQYIVERGIQLERLEYGAIRYSVNGMSVVLDDDCMSKEVKENVKYLILRPNCKLYSKWDDSASLIF